MGLGDRAVLHEERFLFKNDTHNHCRVFSNKYFPTLLVDCCSKSCGVYTLYWNAPGKRLGWSKGIDRGLHDQLAVQRINTAFLAIVLRLWFGST